MRTIVITLLIFFSTATLCDANRLHPEKWYQLKWCREHNGKPEFILPDNTRCDCLTETHAIEFDFANHWHEAIGQSLFYSLQTAKRAGIVLILESDNDYKYWTRLNTTIRHFDLPIDVWLLRP